MERRENPALLELEQLGLAETVQTRHGKRRVYSEKGQAIADCLTEAGPTYLVWEAEAMSADSIMAALR